MKIILFIAALATFVSCSKEISIVIPENATVEINFGVEKLKSTLEKEHYRVKLLNSKQAPLDNGKQIIIEPSANRSLPKEGYTIATKGNHIHIKGNDASGTLYACIDLTAEIRDKHAITFDCNYTEQPKMVLRGTCIGFQKPGDNDDDRVYKYPYTPETFPWFYDRQLWIEYLDMLVDNKMNALYLWNGHPFASLVKIDGYQIAEEVDEDTFKKNMEIYSFLTEEAQKRGIWVIQMFYNINASKPFAENARKAIAAFIKQYPKVGLLVGLGDGLECSGDVEWFTKTILPGVKDGLQALGRDDEPPVIILADSADSEMATKAALPIYKNIYAMCTYGDETLEAYESSDACNAEPFRYSSPGLIQRSVRAMQVDGGANRLYPQVYYRDYPYTADNLESGDRLKETERNHLRYAAYGRYSWNADRNRNDEITYWSKRISDYYGCGRAGKHILDAYEESGEIAPKLLRKFRLADGNRQTLMLGMFVNQFVNPTKWQETSSARKQLGEQLHEYIEKEWNQTPHTGITPMQMIAEVVAHGHAAVEAIEKAAPFVSRNRDEFDRLRNDMYCYQAFANYFSEKIAAAMNIIRYVHSNNLDDLKKAVPSMEKSLEYYAQLVDLTKDKYLYTNNLHAIQQHIPADVVENKSKTWKELLPLYRDELENFKANIVFLKKYGAISSPHAALRPCHVHLEKPASPQSYALQNGERVFSDDPRLLLAFANELKTFRPYRQSIEGAGELQFTVQEAVSLLIGYFNSNREEFATVVPTTAPAAKIVNAMEVSGCGTVNIHAYTFQPGHNSFDLGKGGLIVLGFVDARNTPVSHVATLDDGNAMNRIDWLFY